MEPQRFKKMFIFIASKVAMDYPIREWRNQKTVHNFPQTKKTYICKKFELWEI